MVLYICVRTGSNWNIKKCRRIDLPVARKNSVVTSSFHARRAPRHQFPSAADAQPALNTSGRDDSPCFGFYVYILDGGYTTIWFNELYTTGALFPTNAAAPSSRMGHIFGIMLTTTNSGRGSHSRIFIWRPRAGASGKNVCRTTTGLKKGQQPSGVSVERECLIVIVFFPNGPVPYVFICTVNAEY